MFGKITRLKINIDKSVVITIRCQALDLDNILLNFRVVQKYLPCTYLGLPLSLRKIRRVQLQPCIDKIEVRLAGYKRNMLSRAGRLAILKTVLTAMPIYQLTVADLPTWARKRIDKC